MFKDAGYKTAYFGKWQLSGGDETIRAFGFDSYCVINPILGNPIVRYKNLTIYSNGQYASSWTEIAKIKNPNKNGVTKTYSATSNIPLAQIFIQFRFTYTKGTGTLALDDVSINYNNPIPLFVAGYNNVSVKTN